MEWKKIVLIVKLSTFLADLLVLGLGLGGIISRELTVNLLLLIIVAYAIFLYINDKKRKQK